MSLSEIQAFFDNNKALLALVSAIGGGILTGIVAFLRNRIQLLEYTVTHDRVGVAGDDSVFGSVRVTWQGHEVTNLFISVVTLENRTQQDFVNLKFKAFTSDTLLLTQFTELPGTSFILSHTPEYEQAMLVAPGHQPTEAQMNRYRHEREYLAPVLNRKQKAVIRFLTTVTNPANGPAVWLDLLHPGLRVQYKPSVPQIHGVAVRTALSVGLIACALIVALSGIFMANPWGIALICMISGLFAQSIGAFLYRAARFALRVFLR